MITINDKVPQVLKNEKVKIRNPQATRPWQHVLEPLSGYLLLGQRLLDGQKEFAESWNFGPSEGENIAVGEIVDHIKKAWQEFDYEINQTPDQPHETGMLRLDCSKAHAKLHWTPVWAGRENIAKTAKWYRAFYESSEVQSMDNLKSYFADAKRKHLIWAEE